ncbi:MAG: radical SAM protein [Gemmatimonadaceae bacterium]|nr:radical SAM protein [Gemmatimonadaceae bacterium]NUQ91533.1 radical SAM protein [Gemmatimonadaceae bacterium]
MSARVLLVSTNRERAPYPVIPNGLACVASALDAAGHDVRVLDLMFARDPERTASRIARELAPDVVGVSVRNIDNSDAIALRHYTPDAVATLAALRESAPRAKIVAGGAAFGVAPLALFRALGVDYAVAGDGERATVALVDALAAGREPGEIPGLVRARDGGAVFSPPGENADLDALPRPQLHRWFDLARYERIGATVPIQTKRGCVYKCVYCTYRNVEGWGYRLRDAESVADEIAELRAHGVRHFDFVDSTFNSPPGHARDVCAAIARRRLGVTLETTNFTPAAAFPDLLEAMRGAGFTSLGITAESASDVVLERMRKGFSATTVHRAAERVEAAGIRALWIFLVGGPGETAETLEETLRFADWRLRRGDAVYTTVGLRVYPGTTLHEIAIGEGRLAADDPLLDPAFYFSPGLTIDAAVARLRRFAAGHPRFMFSADSRSMILPWLTRAASVVRLPRPHWRYMGLFQRLARMHPLRRAGASAG